MLSFSRQAYSMWGRRFVQRSFFASPSSLTPAMEKLSAIIAENSEKNFNQGLPTRVVATIVDAIDEDGKGLLSAGSAKLALRKVEANNVRLSNEEAWDILTKELGVQNEEDKVPSEHFWRLVFGNVPCKKKMQLW